MYGDQWYLDEALNPGIYAETEGRYEVEMDSGTTCWCGCGLPTYACSCSLIEEIIASAEGLDL